MKPKLIQRLTPEQRKTKSALKNKHFAAAPKKPATVPKYLRPYIDLWREYGGTKHLDEYTKTFKSGVRLLKKLLKGTAFDTTTYRYEWGGHHFTLEEFETSLKNLHLAIASDHYHPKDKSYIKNISLEDFIFHGYGRNGDVSLFLKYLERKPPRLLPDNNSRLTELITSYYQENVLGGEDFNPSLSTKDRFVLASTKLADFFERNEHLISPGFPLDEPRMVRWLFESIRISIKGYDDPKLTPGHLCSNLTFEQRLPTFLTDQAIFKDRHTII